MKKALCLFFVMILLFSGCAAPPEPNVPEPSNVLTREDIIASNKSIDESQIELIQFIAPQNGDVVMTMATTVGDMHFILYPELAPYAVTAFIENVNGAVYRGASIDEVINNFTIAINGKEEMAKTPSFALPAEEPSGEGENADEESEQPPAPPVIMDVETSWDLWHFRGALGMKNNLLATPESKLTEIYIIEAYEISETVLGDMAGVGYPPRIITKYTETGGVPGYDSNYTVFGQLYHGWDTLDRIASTRVDDDFSPKTQITIVDIYITTYDLANSPEKVRDLLTRGEGSVVLEGEGADDSLYAPNQEQAETASAGS